MINLPKPSPLSARDNSDKSNYFINYLNKLVKELERILGGIKTNNTTEEIVFVKNVNYSNGYLYISYSNGSIQKFDLS